MEYRKKPVVEYDKMIGKYHLVASFMTRGYRCGYLGMPVEEWIEHNKIEPYYFDGLKVHGGVTFGYEHPAAISVGKAGYGYIGFDCNHIGDNKDFDKIREYGFDMKDIYEEDLDNVHPGTVKTLQYVIDELKILLQNHRDSDGKIAKYCNNNSELYDFILYKDYEKLKEEDMLFLKLINKY
jgi:hypothetical protein